MPNPDSKPVPIELAYPMIAMRRNSYSIWVKSSVGCLTSYPSRSGAGVSVEVSGLSQCRVCVGTPGLLHDVGRPGIVRIRK